MYVYNCIYVQVEVSPLEHPERMFVVEDDEVTVEKYISEEERQRLEEIARLEEGKLNQVDFLVLSIFLQNIKYSR